MRFLSDILFDTMHICIIYRKIYTSDSESLAYILYRQMTKLSFFSRFRKRTNLESRLFSSFRKLNAGICSVHFFGIISNAAFTCGTGDLAELPCFFTCCV